MKKTVFGALALALCQISFGQPFQKTIMDQSGLPYDYSSIIKLQEDQRFRHYLVVGSRQSQDLSHSDATATLINSDGSVDYNMVFDYNEKDAFLDAVVGVDNDIVATGFTQHDNKRSLILTQFNNVLQHIKTKEIVIEASIPNPPSYRSSMGFTIAYDASREEYIVGGMTYNQNIWPVVARTRGFVMKLDADLDVLWVKEFRGNAVTGYNGANDILVSPAGILLVGSYDPNNLSLPAKLQGEAIVMLDHNGTVKWDLSHRYGGGRTHGINAVYENDNNGTLYVLGNNFDDHNAQVTVIQNANTTTPSITSEYVMLSHFSTFAHGNTIDFTPADSDKLVIMGLHEEASYSLTSKHSPAYMIEFDKHTGANRQSSVYTVASSDYPLYTEQLLNPFNTHAKKNQVYSPSAMVRDHRGTGYTFLAHRRMPNAQYDIFNPEIWNVIGPVQVHNDCGIGENPTSVFRNTLTVFQTLTFHNSGVVVEDINPRLTSADLDAVENCPDGGEKSAVGINETKAASFEVYPNPSSTGRVTVKAGQGNKNIRLFNPLGTEVLRQTKSTEVFDLDLSGLSPGIYYLDISDGQGRSTKKITIQ